MSHILMTQGQGRPNPQGIGNLQHRNRGQGQIINRSSPGTRSRPYPQPQRIGQSGNPESNQRFAPESTLPLNGQELSK